MKPKFPFIFLFLITVLFSGLMASGQTTINGSFVHNGLTRTYRIYIPAVYQPSVPVPLVFNLHGYSSNNIAQEYYGDFRPIADTANFIIVHPNGTPDGNGNLFWNTFNSSGVDDVGFLSDLLDTVMASFNVDANRVYSTGMSNGGFMSYELACMLSNRITAIASVTGSMTWNKMNVCNPVHPVPVMQIHGTADPTVPYNGNLVTASIDSLVSYWRQKNGCNPIPVISQVPDINLLDGCNATHFVYNGGYNGSSVELFRVNNGGHTWPGAPVSIGVTNMDFSASAEIWRFFSQYSLSGLTNLNSHPGEPVPAVFPNPSSGEFQINSNTKSTINVHIFNILGEEVFQKQGLMTGERIKVHQPGIYLIVVETDDIKTIHRILIQP
jgi:polyhydroxybutyrate depolymerase